MKKKLLFIFAMVAWMAAGAQSLRCDSIVAKNPDGKSVDKIVNTYDAEGDLVGKVRSIWDDFSESWKFDSRYEYAYDNNKNMTLQLYVVWNTNAWKNEEKTEFVYNGSNKLLSLNSFKWTGNEWQPTFKGMATFDANGNMLTNVQMLYDASLGKWLAISKEESFYNEENLPVLITFYIGVIGSDEFAPSFKSEYSYNGKGDMILRFTSDWDAELNKWTGTSKEESTFNQVGNKIKVVTSMKNYETGELIESTKIEKSYDSRNNMILDLFYNKDTEGNWATLKKEEFTYNEMDSVSVKTTFNKDFMTGTLLPSGKTQYAYDDAGRRLSVLSFFWNSAENEWVESTKEEKTYNEDGKLLTHWIYLWNVDYETSQGDWKSTYKSEYAYDANGYCILSVVYTFDLMANVWVGQNKSESVYNESGNILEEISYQWLGTTEEWKKVGSIVYYYSVATSISTIHTTPVNITVHEGLIEISCEETTRISVYDATGKMISRNSKFVRTTQSGLYIVVLNDAQSYKVAVK